MSYNRLAEMFIALGKREETILRGVKSHQKEVEGLNLPSYQSVKGRRQEEAKRQTSHHLPFLQHSEGRDDVSVRDRRISQETETTAVTCTGKC